MSPFCTGTRSNSPGALQSAPTPTSKKLARLMKSVALSPPSTTWKIPSKPTGPLVSSLEGVTIPLTVATLPWTLRQFTSIRTRTPAEMSSTSAFPVTPPSSRRTASTLISSRFGPNWMRPDPFAECTGLSAKAATDTAAQKSAKRFMAAPSRSHRGQDRADSTDVRAPAVNPWASIRFVRLIRPRARVVAVAHDVRSVGRHRVGRGEIRCAGARVERAQVLHPGRRGPTEGVGPAARGHCISDHDRTVAGNVERLGGEAAQSTDILHPACRGPAERPTVVVRVRRPADHDRAVRRDAERLAREAAQRAEPLLSGGRRPAVRLIVSGGVIRGSHHHRAVGGDPVGVAVEAARMDSEILHPRRCRPTKCVRVAARVVRVSDHDQTVGRNLRCLGIPSAQGADVLQTARGGPAERALVEACVPGLSHHHRTVARDSVRLGERVPEVAEVLHAGRRPAERAVRSRGFGGPPPPPRAGGRHSIRLALEPPNPAIHFSPLVVASPLLLSRASKVSVPP